MGHHHNICCFQAVTIADIARGQQALKEIEQEFGPNRAIFVKTDVTNAQQLEGK